MASSVSWQDKSYPALQLATRAGKTEAILAARDFPPRPAGRISPKAI